MTVTLENTTRIVELIVDGHPVQARVWEGVTGEGIPCHAFITRIAVHNNDNAAEFERDLKRQRDPSPALAAAIPLRMVI
jgi:hypothetical protein